MQVSIYLAGGAGTLLAAINFDIVGGAGNGGCYGVDDKIAGRSGREWASAVQPGSASLRSIEV